MQRAIDEQEEHFDTLGLDLGHSYEVGALVPDGSPAVTGENIVSDYVPSTRPGCRLPHAWLEKGAERISTLDLIDRRAPVLLTGAAGAAWCDAAEGLGISATTIGDHSTVRDSEGTWAALRAIADDGALLVRPDGHVGWRAMGPSEDAPAELRSALERILPPDDD